MFIRTYICQVNSHRYVHVDMPTSHTYIPYIHTYIHTYSISGQTSPRMVCPVRAAGRRPPRWTSSPRGRNISPARSSPERCSRVSQPRHRRGIYAVSCINVCVCMYVWMNVSIRLYAYVCMYVCIYVCMYVCMMFLSVYMRMYVCMFNCIFVSVF